MKLAPVLNVGPAHAVVDCPSSKSPSEWCFGLLCAAILALNLGLDLYRLDLPSLWLDEAISWRNASGSWSEGWSWAAGGEDCGGFAYFCLLKLAMAGLGTSELALRLPSVALGFGFVAMMMSVGYSLWGRAAALVIGLLAALHPEVICWFRQARGYSLELFASAWCLAALLAYARTARRLHAWSLFAACSIAAASHVFGVFLVGGAGVFLAIQRWQALPSGRPLRSALGLWPVAIPVVMAACWAVQMRARITANLDNFWISGSIPENYKSLLESFWGKTIWLVLGGIVWLLRDRARPNNRLVLGVLGCCAPFLLCGPLLASWGARSHNFILCRYFLPALALGLLPTAYLLSRLPPRFAVLASLALGIGFLATSDWTKLYSEHGLYHKDTRNAARFLLDNRDSHDRVLVYPDYEASSLVYYQVPSSILSPVPDHARFDQVLQSVRQESTTGSIWLVTYAGLPEVEGSVWVFGQLKVIRLN